MNKIIITLTAAVTGIVLTAAPARVNNCEVPHGFSVNGVGLKAIEHMAGGKTGKCFRLSCPANRKELTFHDCVQTPVASASAPVKIRCEVKGKAEKFSFGFLCYDKNRKLIYPEGQPERGFSVNSPDKWTTIEFTYTPVAGGVYASKIGFVMPSVRLKAGQQIMIDDITLEFIDTTKNITIED